MKNELVHSSLVAVRAMLEEAKERFDLWYDSNIPDGDSDNGLDKANAIEVSNHIDSAIIDLNMVIGSDIVRREVMNKSGLKI